MYRLITRSVVEEGILSRADMKKDLDNKIIQAGLFNQKSSENERHQTLQQLIKKDYEKDDDSDTGNNEGSHEDEFYSDE